MEPEQKCYWLGVDIRNAKAAGKTLEQFATEHSMAMTPELPLLWDSFKPDHPRGVDEPPIVEEPLIPVAQADRPVKRKPKPVVKAKRKAK